MLALSRKRMQRPLGVLSTCVAYACWSHLLPQASSKLAPTANAPRTHSFCSCPCALTTQPNKTHVPLTTLPGNHR